MNTPIFISIAVLAVIAAIEVVCLFGCSRLNIRTPSVTVAVPILPGDGELPEKLKYMGMLLADVSIGIDRIILLDCGAAPEQLDLCFAFCNDFPKASLTTADGLVEYLI